MQKESGNTYLSQYPGGQIPPNRTQNEHLVDTAINVGQNDNQFGSITMDPDSASKGYPTFLNSVPITDLQEEHPVLNINTPQYYHGDRAQDPGPMSWLKNPQDSTESPLTDPIWYGNGPLNKTASMKFESIMKAFRSPYKKKIDIEARKVHVSMDSGRSKPEEGLFTFNCKTLDDNKDKKNRSVYIQLEDRPGEDSSKVPLHQRFVKLGCTCPHFLYYGQEYYANRGGYLVEDQERTPDGKVPMPTLFNPNTVAPRDPSQRGNGKGTTYCKHIRAVYSFLKDSHFSDEITGEAKHPDPVQNALSYFKNVDKFYSTNGKQIEPDIWAKAHGILKLPSGYDPNPSSFLQYIKKIRDYTIRTGYLPRYLQLEVLSKTKGEVIRSIIAFLDRGNRGGSARSGKIIAGQSENPNFILGLTIYTACHLKESRDEDISLEFINPVYKKLTEILDSL